jgi:hypothetical protein
MDTAGLGPECERSDGSEAAVLAFTASGYDDGGCALEWSPTALFDRTAALRCNGALLFDYVQDG